MRKKLLGDISWILIFTIFLICFPSKMNNAKAASGNVSNTVGEVKEFVSGDTVTFEGEKYNNLAYYFLYDEEQEGRIEKYCESSVVLTLPTVEELKKSYSDVYNLLNEKKYKFPKSGIIKWKIEALGEVLYKPTIINNNTETPGNRYITYSITPVECDCSLSLDDTDCTWTNENQNQIYGYAGEEITLPNQDDISKSDNYLLGWKEGEAEDSTATYSYTFSGQEKTLYPVWTSVGVKVNNGSGTGGYKKGDTVTITANKIEGNDFVEWTVDSGNVALNDASSETTTFTMGDESAEITARYKHYSVKFLNEDGSQIEEQTVEYGKDATAPKSPTKEGYTFKGWDKDFTKVSTNLEVKPIFEINKYSVKFLNEDGSQIGEEQTVEYGKDATAPEVPTKENYTFKGWDKDFTKVSTNLEVKPIFEINKYSVKFLNEDGSQIEEQTVEYGEDATAPEAPTKEGYTFKGWDKDFTKVNTNLEVKPIFEINKYSVKFLNEDGSQIGEEQTVEYGKDATAPEAPTKENYTFKGWDKDFTKVSTNLEVKPIFEINKYSVKFLNEDGSQIGEEQTVEYGKDATAPKAPTKEGYTFKGWDKDFTKVSTNLEVKPIFEINKYSVKFLNEDGSQIGEEQTVEYGKDATAPEAPTKENYTFKGWDKDFTKVSTNLEVKPIFEINKYSVKFLNEDGSQIGEEQTVEYGKGATAPKAPTKEGYTFKGWDKDFTKVNTNLEVKPIFEINKYSVKFLNEDGSQIGEEQTVEYGKGATAPKAPTKEGYTFKGWDKQFNVITSNMEIKAVFTKNEQPNTGDVSNNTALLLVLFASMGIGLTLKKVKEYN